MNSPVQNQSPGPLAGLRVIELAGIGPGPFAATMLADLGAEVVRIDRPDPSIDVIAPEIDMLRRNRRSVVLDLRNPSAVQAVMEMMARTDVLIEGNRPGVAERLGLGPQDCWKCNPRLVYGRMTGWGQDGPLSHTAGHDISYIAITGALHAIGRSDGPPAIPLNVVGDFAGGSMYLVMGVLAAVFEANRSGRGQVVDAAIVDGVSSLTGMMHSMMACGAWRAERGRNLLDSGVPWYNVYETADGQWMAVGPIEPKFYAQFMTLLDLPPDEAYRSDPAAWPQLSKELASAFARHTRDEWVEVFEGADACVAPVLSFAEAPDHPHLVARDTFIDVAGVRQPAPAPRFSRTPGSVRLSPTIPGTHTIETLRDWGVTDVEELLESGAATQA